MERCSGMKGRWRRRGGELLEFLTHLVRAVRAREAKETYGERNSGESQGVLLAVSSVRKEFLEVVKSDEPSAAPDVGLFSIITLFGGRCLSNEGFECRRLG
ncbi:hypothetical protein K0M31_020282 [Melipona bicolor]|uniref:Uncharacterized protein n=1 Tax=Melipona bicolor TaxID=60889 RepID=A0AA40G1V1_9HYME|nr:hypothetical protein K0M31_020282 [Melipona bicolor]